MTITRRNFGGILGVAGAVWGMGRGSALGVPEAPKDADGRVIPGFEKTKDEPIAAKAWQPVSDRKVKVGIAGYGLCKFGAVFFYQNHPNVEVVAATDLDPGRCAELAKAVGARKTYPSCEEMIKDKNIEAVYIATDAPSHAMAYYISITGKRFTEVSGLGTESYYPVFKEVNQYRNSFGTEIAMLKTSEGGISRMGVSWDMKNAEGEQGRVYGEKPHDKKIDGSRPPLPPSVGGGGHGGSHGRLTNDFIESILLDRKPIVDIGDALNMTLAGTMAHASALKGGEWMKIPQYTL